MDEADIFEMGALVNGQDADGEGKPDRDERRRWKEKKQTEASILHEARYLDCEALSSLLRTYSNANQNIRTVP